MIPPVADCPTEEKLDMDLVHWKNTFSMRQATLQNLAASQPGVKNGNKTAIANCRKSYSITSPIKSLDLLRRNLQSAINNDINNVIKKYLDKFFQPAIINIKANLGKDSVNDDHINEMCKKMLEDAKSMYKKTTGSRDSSPYSQSDSDASAIDGKIARMSPKHRKRKESDTDLETHWSQKRPKVQSYNLEHTSYKLPIKREGLKWNPERITDNTLFIMGARANKVLGFGQTRGRLYVRHPDLVRYSGDQEDKEWLSSKNLMQPTGGKAYIMILDDIKELTENDDYRNSANLQLHELKGFHVPQFLTTKIRIYMQNVRTDKDKKPPCLGLDLFDVRCQSITPPSTVLDSEASTPSDLLQFIESQSGSTSSYKSETFINIPEISPSSSQSILSNNLLQSPIHLTDELLSPNTLMTLASTDFCNSGVMVLKENTQNDTCLSSILANGLCSEILPDLI